MVRNLALALVCFVAIRRMLLVPDQLLDHPSVASTPTTCRLRVSETLSARQSIYGITSDSTKFDPWLLDIKFGRSYRISFTSCIHSWLIDTAYREDSNRIGACPWTHLPTTSQDCLRLRSSDILVVYNILFHLQLGHSMQSSVQR